jgi:hypothetical protein
VTASEVCRSSDVQTRAVRVRPLAPPPPATTWRLYRGCTEVVQTRRSRLPRLGRGHGPPGPPGLPVRPARLGVSYPSTESATGTCLQQPVNPPGWQFLGPVAPRPRDPANPAGQVLLKVRRRLYTFISGAVESSPTRIQRDQAKLAMHYSECSNRVSLRILLSH